MATIDYLEGEYDIVDRPLAWQTAGLQWTATGYGARIPTRAIIRLPDGAIRRVYCTVYSNAGSLWIVLKGRRMYLRGEGGRRV